MVTVACSGNDNGGGKSGSGGQEAAPACESSDARIVGDLVVNGGIPGDGVMDDEAVYYLAAEDRHNDQPPALYRLDKGSGVNEKLAECPTVVTR